MKWTRTAFRDPSQHYSACIYNDDPVLSGWAVIWVDKYRQYDCLRSQMDLPHTVLVSSCWPRPTLWRCRATVFFRMLRCILIVPSFSIMIAITGVDLDRWWISCWRVQRPFWPTVTLMVRVCQISELCERMSAADWGRGGDDQSLTHTPTASGASLWASPIKSTYHCIDPLTGTSGHTRQSCRDVFQLYRKHG